MFPAAIDGPPGLGALVQNRIERLNVFDAAIFEPVLEGCLPLFGIDGNPRLPGRAAAEDAGEVRSGLRRNLERLAEDLVSNSSAQIDEWLGCGRCGSTEVLHRLGAGAGRLFAGKRACTLDELHIDGN